MKYLLVMVAALGLCGCVHEDYATPEERQRLEATDALIAEKQATADSIEARILELRSDLETLEDLAAAATKFEELMVEYRAANEAIDGAVAEQREITAAIEARTGGAALDVLLPFVPEPARAPLAALSVPLVGLFFKRTREHAKNAVVNTAKGSLGQAVTDLMRAFGWMHTTEDPDKLAATAEMLRLKAEAKAKVQA
jgi:DNA-binding SARP family transcriptional activator